MRVVASTVANVHIVNVSDMYKVRKYHSLDSETFERNINIFFCKDNNCKVVTMYSPIEYYVIVVFKEVEDENKGKRDN